MINTLENANYVVGGIVYRSPETVGTLIEVRGSQGKGLGVYALRDVEADDLVLREKPLVEFADNGSRADPLDGLVNGLDPALRKAYRSLHGFTPLAKGVESLNRRVLYSNGFAIGDTTTAILEMGSRFNHSCVPNTQFQWNAEKGMMEYRAGRKILEGEEITIDYGHKRGHLKRYYGFECDCGSCVTSHEVLGDAVKAKEGIPSLATAGVVVNTSLENLESLEGTSVLESSS